MTPHPLAKLDYDRNVTYNDSPDTALRNDNYILYKAPHMNAHVSYYALPSCDIPYPLH